jgi:penicillin-binding protein 1C
VGGTRNLRRFGLRAAAVSSVAAALLLLVFELVVLLVPTPDLAKADKISPTVLADDGSILKIYLSDDHVWRLRTSRQDVPQAYLDMLFAYEDRRFYRHFGIDLLAVSRASYDLMRYRTAVSGASTLSMQVVRLLERQRPGLPGKIVQALQAIKLERRLDKNAILDLYLTLAPFGGNIEGVRAASLQYFGHEPKSMTLAQSALLIALPQSPERRKPRPAGDSTRDARDRVLRRLAAQQTISQFAAQEASRRPIPDGRGAHLQLAHHLSDRLRSETPGTSSIRTLVDRRLQVRAEDLTKTFVAQQPDLANTAVLIVRRHDMAVRAYIGGGAYFDASRSGMVDLVRAVRSPGSTLKPLIYGLAFEETIVHPETIVSDDNVRIRGYAPENFDKKYRGELTARDALVQSVNTIAVMLLDRVGVEHFVGRVRTAGIGLELPDPRTPPSLAIALGGAGITLENLTKLYAGIANDGMVRPLRLRADEDETGPSRLVSRDAAWMVTDILADAPPAKGRAVLRSRDGGRQIGYKTGTSYGFRDAWAIGFNRDHVVAVWIGRPDGAGRPGETGAGAAVPLMHQIFGLLPVPLLDVAGHRPAAAASGDREVTGRLTRYAAAGSSLKPSTQQLPAFRFPVNGSTIKLERTGASMAISIVGGSPPYSLYVDGKSVETQSSESSVSWMPKGRGQATFVVVDSTGMQASTTAWFD